MLTYIIKFIPNLSNETLPLKYILKEDNEFLWQNEQEIALKKLKNVLITKPVLQFF